MPKPNLTRTLAVLGLSVLLVACEMPLEGAVSDEDGGVELDDVSKAGATQCVEAQENLAATLSCPSGAPISSIQFASYGSPTGSCQSGFAASTCNAQSSLAQVKAACLNKSSCSVLASNSVFGDPCGGVHKKLGIVYTCSPITDPCAVASEGGSVNLACPSGRTIQAIKFASYGTPSGSCAAGFSTGACHASSSLQKVQTACLGRQSCSVAANNGVFADPCGGASKRLSVVYTCSAPTTTDACPSDPNKTAPGACGCGVADTDGDRDGTPDCKDGCKADANKISPGLCGCGTPEGTCGGTTTCPPPVAKPAVGGCDGVLLTDPNATEARTNGITNTTGPAGSTALRFGDEQSIDVKDAGCMQLGKNRADFSLSMWLKPTAGSSQIIGTTSQHSGAQGFVLYAETRSDGVLLLSVESFGPGFAGQPVSAPVTPGAWVHVALRYDADGQGEQASISLDVNLDRRTAAAATNVYNSGLRIGDQGWGTTSPFEVSELRSYARLLSDAEVRNLFLDKAIVTGVSAATLGEALSRLQGHVDATTVLSYADLATATQRFSSSSVLLGVNAGLMDQALRLVESYEAKVGPVFMTTATRGGFLREENAGDGLQLARTMLKVQQAVIDQVFVPDAVEGCATRLSGKRFRTADYFPGLAPAPSDPTRSYNVTIDASVRPHWGRPVAFSKDPARRPTGLYLSPGSISEITVPDALVNRGFRVLVGAHTHDLSQKWKFLRMDRVSTSFPITRRVTRIANPLGGGIYIIVPYLANAGKVSVSVRNVIEAPFFAYKSWHKTTAAQWQVSRSAPAPWADFETEKYMVQVPRSWIYASGDPSALMTKWNSAMDGVSELMGFPPDERNRTVLYLQVDLIIPGVAHGIGYPQVNILYDPQEAESGNKDHWLLRDPLGPGSKTVYHELGHAHWFSKFRGEWEATVNLLHAYARNVKFGVPFDVAFRESFGTNRTFAGYTPDDAAIHWMITENFRAGREMDYSDTEKDEFRYQHRGYAKYGDIYRIFGWQPLRSFFYQENLDYNSGVRREDLDVDSRILRLSIAAGADLTPLIHFWGIAPVNASALKQQLAQRGIGRSEAVRAHIARYKSLAPRNNADFNAHYERVYPGRPIGDNPNYGPGWYNVWRNRFNETHAAQVQAQIDRILKLYYGG